MATAQPPAIAPAPHPHHNPAQESLHDQGLRDHQVVSSYPPPPSTDYERAGMQGSTPPSSQDYPPSSRDLDPAMGGAPGVMSTGGDSGGDDSPDGRKGYGKRELSTSKRAAQNRAAQRAFRQRKEGYIKKLEEQVRDYAGLSESYKSLQGENYQLRDYIINLQSRLLESQGDYPQPPPNVNLPHPSDRPQQPIERHDQAPPAPRPSQMEYDALNQLRAAARQDYAAAAAAAGNKHPSEPGYPTDPHLSKRLKTDGTDGTEQIQAQDALQGGAMAIEPRIATSPNSRDLSVGSVLNQNTRERNNSRPMLST